jgi:diguanylate cyclase (GGDEF)-like protein/PAS domain S-box-containing protein
MQKAKNKILVVDDDPEMAEYISLLLKAMGYEVVGPVSNGKDAFAVLKTQQPELAIIDIMLNDDMDGIEVSQILKDDFNIYTIYCSAHSDKKMFVRAKKTEPLAFLLKPISSRELELTVELALSKIQIKEKLIESEFHFKNAQQIGNIGSWSWDIRNDTLHWTDQIYRIFGMKPQEFGATYESFLEYIHPDDVEMVNSYVERALSGDGPYQVQHRLLLKNGEERQVIERGEVEFNEKGAPVKMQGTVQDITELHEAQKQIQRLAYYDITTNLPNRNLFFDRLEQTLALQRREDKTFAVLAIDLDGFKGVNDTYGHQMGDNLLKEVASRMQHTVRDVDMVARTGGDEFMAIIWGIIKTNDIKVVAEKLLSACSKPFVFGNVNIEISCSIGISICPDHSVKDEELIKLADKAMYSAKSDGKNTFRIYDD